MRPNGSDKRYDRWVSTNYTAATTAISTADNAISTATTAISTAIAAISTAIVVFFIKEDHVACLLSSVGAAAGVAAAAVAAVSFFMKRLAKLHL